MTAQPPNPADDADQSPILRPARITIMLAMFLVVAADILFWGQAVGLSLAVFAVLIWCAALTVLRPDRVPWVSFLVMLAGIFPVIDYVQALSVAILILSLVASLVVMAHPLASVGGIASGMVRVIGRVLKAGPLAWWVAVIDLVEGGLPKPPTGVRRVLRDWAFPVGGTLIFAALIVKANPVIGQTLSLISLPDLLSWMSLPDLPRVLFWLGTAMIVWPFIEGAVTSARAFALPDVAGAERVIGINAPSVLRALVMFNVAIAVQTALDITILAGGAALPEGMSFASYAHRGAYPLLATALLAGAFAIVARPHLSSHAAIRPLMMLWLAQNVVLCVSAALRLEIYVAAYGLTYLRIYALIWMAVVAAGLALIAWQTWRGRTNAWLMLRGAGLCLGTLYICAFVNFAGVIVRHNLAEDVRTDWDYLCSLGPMGAAGAFPEPYPDRNAALCGWQRPQATGWRDWQFRVVRAAQSPTFAPSAAVDDMRE